MTRSLSNCALMRAGLIIASLATPMRHSVAQASPGEIADPYLHTVFIGAVEGLNELAAPAIVGGLIASGRVGLYQHAVGMTRLFQNDNSSWKRLLATWGPTGIPPGGGGASMAEEGQIATLDVAIIGDAFAIFGSARRLPATVVVNIETGSASYLSQNPKPRTETRYQRFVTEQALAQIELAVGNLKRVGAASVLINATPNYPLADIDNPFRRSVYWARIRQAYQFAGGGAFDTPPTYFMQADTAANPYVGERYRSNVAQQLQWLNANHLKSAVIVSPCGPQDPLGNNCANSYDAEFLANTRRLVAYLAAYPQLHPGGSALPTMWVVENYPTRPGNMTNRATGPEGLIAIAQWLAEHAPTSGPNRIR